MRSVSQLMCYLSESAIQTLNCLTVYNLFIWLITEAIIVLIIVPCCSGNCSDKTVIRCWLFVCDFSFTLSLSPHALDIRIGQAIKINPHFQKRIYYLYVILGNRPGYITAVFKTNTNVSLSLLSCSEGRKAADQKLDCWGIIFPTLSFFPSSTIPDVLVILLK